MLYTYVRTFDVTGTVEIFLELNTCCFPYHTRTPPDRRSVACMQVNIALAAGEDGQSQHHRQATGNGMMSEPSQVPPKDKEKRNATQSTRQLHCTCPHHVAHSFDPTN